jgi:actin-like ATPase involved in cell morphogenesis
MRGIAQKIQQHHGCTNTGEQHMTRKEMIKFANDLQEYVHRVAIVLSETMGEQAACERVLESLSLVVQGALDRTPPEAFAPALLARENLAVRMSGQR